MDFSKSLEDLENDYWEKPEFESSLTLKCYQLRKVPLSKLSAENLRMLIAQQFSLDYTVPLALNMLESDILVCGDMYEGDLLNSVAGVEEQFWKANPELNNRLVGIKTEVEQTIETLSEILLQLEKRVYS